MVYHRILNVAPSALQWTLLFIHSLCNSWCLLTPSSRSIPPRLPLLLSTTGLVSTSVGLLFLIWLISANKINLTENVNTYMFFFVIVPLITFSLQIVESPLLELKNTSFLWGCLLRSFNGQKPGGLESTDKKVKERERGWYSLVYAKSQ